MEYFDVIDESGAPTGQTVSREQAHAEGIPHRTAHIWILRKKDGRPQALLQKRSMEKDSFPGCLDTSSAGHIAAGDAPLESALRELKEELGITAAPEELEFIGTARILFERVFHGKLFRDNELAFLHVLKRPVSEAEITVQKEELDGVEWHDLEEIRRAVETGDPAFCVPASGLAVIEQYLRNAHAAGSRR